jgi:hypothetical protein
LATKAELMKELWAEHAYFLLLSFGASDEALNNFAAAGSYEVVDPTPEEKNCQSPPSRLPAITKWFTSPNHPTETSTASYIACLGTLLESIDRVSKSR